MSMESDAARHAPKQRGGVFDVRSVIGLFLGVYGVVLTVTGLVGTTDADLAKAGGANVNLWTGAGLLVTSAVFFTWARLRPILVPTYGDDTASGGDGGFTPGG
jgi:drug/metabolite transporter (DMT)-like permease